MVFEITGPNNWEIDSLDSKSIKDTDVKPVKKYDIRSSFELMQAKALLKAQNFRLIPPSIATGIALIFQRIFKARDLRIYELNLKKFREAELSWHHFTSSTYDDFGPEEKIGMQLYQMVIENQSLKSQDRLILSKFIERIIGNEIFYKKLQGRPHDQIKTAVDPIKISTIDHLEMIFHYTLNLDNLILLNQKMEQMIAANEPFDQSDDGVKDLNHLEKEIQEGLTFFQELDAYKLMEINPSLGQTRVLFLKTQNLIKQLKEIP